MKGDGRCTVGLVQNRWQKHVYDEDSKINQQMIEYLKKKGYTIARSEKQIA
jgi:hypothetical protein